MDKYRFSILIVFLALITTACPPNNVGPIFQSKEIYKYYLAHGWVPLPEPDSRFVPGMIVKIDKARQEFLSLGSLKDCGVPESAFGADGTGSGAQLSFTVDNDYGANAVLKIHGVSAGPEWSKVYKATLTLDKHGTTTANLAKFKLYLADTTATFPDACKSLLSAADTYVVYESYFISKGSYTLKDKDSAKISLTGLQAGPLNIGADAHATPSADGSLTYDETLYTAMHTMKYDNGNWTVLGQATDQSSSDQEIIRQLPYLQNLNK